MRPDHPGNWRATRSLIDVFCTRTRGRCRRLPSSQVRASCYKGHRPKWVPRRASHPGRISSGPKSRRPKLEQRRSYPRLRPKRLGKNSRPSWLRVSISFKRLRWCEVCGFRERRGLTSCISGGMTKGESDQFWGATALANPYAVKEGRCTTPRDIGGVQR